MQHLQKVSYCAERGCSAFRGSDKKLCPWIRYFSS